MKISYAQGMCAIMAVLVTFSCCAQVAGTNNARPPKHTVHSLQGGAPYPRIPISDFTQTWEGHRACNNEKDTLTTLIITAKDSFTVIVSGIHSGKTKVTGIIKGYTVNISRQHLSRGEEVEGRLILSNNRKELKSYLQFYKKGRESNCTVTFSTQQGDNK